MSGTDPDGQGVRETENLGPLRKVCPGLGEFFLSCRVCPRYGQFMIDAAKTDLRMPYEDFLVFERASVERHEWLDGVVYEKQGGTVQHAALIVAIGISLDSQLDMKKYDVFMSDLAIRVLATGLYTYPDVMVVCGRAEVESLVKDIDAVTNPMVIVEVLSDLTEAYDRGDKFAQYRRIPSFVEYVLVSQKEPRIEVFRRTATGTWELHEALAGQTAKLTSIECELSVDEIYADPLKAE